MWKCKHCQNEFDFEKNTEKASHGRWCKSNPNYDDDFSKYNSNKNGKREMMWKKKRWIKVVRYYSNPKHCKECGKTISLQKQENNFCSGSCSAIHSNRNKVKKPKRYSFCKHCDSKIPYKGQYCNNTCYADLKRNVKVESWKSGEIDGTTGNGRTITAAAFVKEFIREKYDNKCARCGYNTRHPDDGKSILEIDHIDGKANNNLEENLILLCPNCHALTSTYRGRNTGNSVRKP